MDCDWDVEHPVASSGILGGCGPFGARSIDKGRAETLPGNAVARLFVEEKKRLFRYADFDV